MKKKRIYILAACLVALLLYFWIQKEQKKVNQMTESKYRASHTLMIIEEQIKKEKMASVNSPTDSTSSINCWEKIREQYRASPDYYSEIRQDLESMAGEWFFNPGSGLEPSLEASKQGKFFAALAKVDLMEGVRTGLSEQEALKFLAEVAALDSENSAPLLFMAIIYDRQGNSQKAASLIQQIQSTSFYNDYIQDFNRQIYSHVRTPADLLSAQDIWATVPIPRTEQISQILKKYPSVQLARQMMKDGLDYEKERITDLSWNPLNYAVGRKALETYGKAEGYPESRVLLAQREKNNNLSANKLVQKLSASCDLNFIEDEVSAVRKLIDQNR